MYTEEQTEEQVAKFVEAWDEAKDRVMHIQSFSDYPKHTKSWIRDVYLKENDILWIGKYNPEKTTAKLKFYRMQKVLALLAEKSINIQFLTM